MITHVCRGRLATGLMALAVCLTVGCATPKYVEPSLPASQAAILQATPGLRLLDINGHRAPTKARILVEPGVTELEYLFSGYVGLGYRDATAHLPPCRCFLRAGHKYRPACDVSRAISVELWLEESEDGHSWRRIPHLPTF